MLSVRHSRRPQLFIAALLAALTLVTYSPQKSEAAANGQKITICHRTHATTNPYRRITVNKSSIFNSGQGISALDDPNAAGNGHGRFQHNDWPGREANDPRPSPNVFDANKTSNNADPYPANRKRWGDIIPGQLDNGDSTNPRTAMPLNYTGVGVSIYNGAAGYEGLCGRKSAKSYCEAEVPALVAAGRTEAQAKQDCLDDLEEQGALDDAPLKNACPGNNISNCDFSKLSVYGTSTGTVTCTGTTATLNGSTNLSTLTGVPTFEYGSTATLGTSVAASPTSVTGVKTFSKSISNLTDGTYYYKAIVTTTDANESVVEGNLESFTLTSGVCTSTGSTNSLTEDPATTTTTVPAGGYKGALRGIVWIDKNLNELQDSDEPGLAFTSLVATLVTSYVGGTPGTKITFKTDALGKYSVPKLEPGKWDVNASLTTDALTRTFDTDDGVGIQSVRAASVNEGSVSANGVHSASVIDWKAKATVPINGLGVADFAAAGDAVLKVAIEIPAECVKSEYVEITWAGLDLKLGTADDATFKVKVKDKEATVRRIPYGNYSVTPICTSGIKLAGEQTVLHKKQVRTVSVNATILPATGQHSSRGVAEVALAMLLIGCFLGVRRRIFS